MIETICQKCGNIKTFSEDKAGKKFKCPSCQEVVAIEFAKTISTQNVIEPYQKNIVEEESKLQNLKEERDAANQREISKATK